MCPDRNDRDPCQQPAWGRSREFDITTRTVSRHGMTQKTSGDLDEDEDEESGEFSLGGGHRKRKGTTVRLSGFHVPSQQLLNARLSRNNPEQWYVPWSKRINLI